MSRRHDNRQVSRSRKAAADLSAVSQLLKQTTPRLSVEESAALSAALHGQPQESPEWLAIRERMASSCYPLVVKLAKRLALPPAVPVDDCVQEGVISLLLAASHYRPEYGTLFGTYAFRAIFTGISRHVAARWRVVRLPYSCFTLSHDIAWFVSVWYAQYGRPPEDEEIAVGIDASLASIKLVRALAVDTREIYEETLPARDRLLGQSARHFSAGDFFARLRQIADTRDLRILSLYYGIDGDPKTLEEVGAIFGVTKERIRQLLSRAIVAARKSLGLVSRGGKAVLAGRGTRVASLRDWLSLQNVGYDDVE